MDIHHSAVAMEHELTLEGGSSSTFSMLWDFFSGNESTSVTVTPDAPTERTSLLSNNRKKITTLKERTGAIVETPDFIRRLQEKLDWELEAIEIKSAYNCALRQSRRYVQGLRLMFLRADCWDARKAALRLVTFFEAKLRLFQSDVLARPIRLSDLDSHDILSLRSGSFQVVEASDPTSRAALCYFPKYHIYHRVENMVRNMSLVFL